jgi:hypothetical protein
MLGPIRQLQNLQPTTTTAFYGALPMYPAGVVEMYIVGYICRAFFKVE